ncbi:MAG: hypothetical protein FJZ58_07060 [Chlamydiae bacterium]|nr:hypothetical protein [Chlamydiota bacterium]
MNKNFPLLSFKGKDFLSPYSLLIGSIILFLPFFLSVIYLIFQQETLGELEQKAQFLQTKLQKKELQLKREEKVLHQIRHSRSNYIKEVLEPMVFLAAERQKWQLFAQKIEPSNSMKERVSFLEKGENILRFKTGEAYKSELFQETEEQQIDPIEVSEEDLKSLLCYVEGIRIHPYIPQAGTPQLLIKSFELEKKTIPSLKEKIYIIQMHLIKREPVSKS